jgi:hypothetical protein
MKSKRGRMSQLLMIFAALAVFATACGGGGGGGGGQTSEQSSAAATTAGQNTPTLSRDLSESELFDTRTGEITNLSEVVTGDRPILVWYWAPH